MILQAQTLEDDDKAGWVDLRSDSGKYMGTMPVITFYFLFGFLPKLNDTDKMDVRITVTKL